MLQSQDQHQNGLEAEMVLLHWNSLISEIFLLFAKIKCHTTHTCIHESLVVLGHKGNFFVSYLPDYNW